MHDSEVAWHSEAVQYQCLPTASAAATAQFLDRHAFAKLTEGYWYQRKRKASCPRLGQKKKTPDVTHMKNVICLLLYWLTRKSLVAVFISEKM